jgi:DNA-binding NtrC family response regulator
VLIVDDDLVVLRVLCGVLSRAGYQVVPAASVAEALRGARCVPDVCLLDLRLPDGSGLDLADALNGRYPGVPLILMSGSAELVRDHPKLKRFVQVLTKPPDLHAIHQAIAAALDQRRAPAQIA